MMAKRADKRSGCYRSLSDLWAIKAQMWWKRLASLAPKGGDE